MAKQQRMFLVTAACVGDAALSAFGGSGVELMPWALGLIVVGCVVTSVRRASRILRELNSK
jgi:hypothetical protein